MLDESKTVPYYPVLPITHEDQMMPSIELKYTFESEEELRAHLGTETRAAPVGAVAVYRAAPVVWAEAPPAATTEVDATAEQRSDADVDSDGMPYNAVVHTETRSTNADGTWKARRGKSEEAKAARAAFKAGGGTEEAPEIEVEETKAAVMPGLPGTEALPVDAPDPVSWDMLVEAITSATKSGSITQDGLMTLYTEHGGPDPAAELQTNETARAAMYAALTK